MSTLVHARSWHQSGVKCGLKHDIIDGAHALVASTRSTPRRMDSAERFALEGLTWL